MRYFFFIILCLVTCNAYAQEFSAPADKATCEGAGGIWAKYGMTQAESCDLPASDAGQPCDSSSECETKLCVVDKQTFDGAPLSGKCFGRMHTFGCHNIYDASAGQVQAVNICVD